MRLQFWTYSLSLAASNGWLHLASLGWRHGWVDGKDLDIEAAIVVAVAPWWSLGSWCNVGCLALGVDVGNSCEEGSGGSERVLHVCGDRMDG